MRDEAIELVAQDINREDFDAGKAQRNRMWVYGDAETRISRMDNFELLHLIGRLLDEREKSDAAAHAPRVFDAAKVSSVIKRMDAILERERVRGAPVLSAAHVESWRAALKSAIGE